MTTTLWEEMPTPLGAEHAAFTVFVRPEVIGGTFVNVQTTLLSEDLTVITLTFADGSVTVPETPLVRAIP